MNLFSGLTSKIFGGLLIAGVAYHVYDEIRDTTQYNNAVEAKNSAVADRNTARENLSKVTAALNECNASKLTAAEIAASVDAAGREAVRSVRRATRNELDRVTDSINQAPAETCVDAEAILRGEAG